MSGAAAVPSPRRFYKEINGNSDHSHPERSSSRAAFTDERRRAGGCPFRGAPGRLLPAVRSLSRPVGAFHCAEDGRPGPRGGPGAGGVYSGYAPSASLRSGQEVLDVDLHDLLEPGEERVTQPFAQSAGAFPETDDALGIGSSAASVRGSGQPPGRSVPQAVFAGSRGADGGGAA